MSRSHRLSLLMLALALIPALAPAQTWTGESAASGAWSQGKNWFGTNVPVAGATAHLTFAGALRLDTLQDRADPFLLQRLSFAAGAGAFSISGGALRFAANAQIDLNGAAPVLMGSALQIDQRLLLEGAGDLDLKGPISRSGANTANNTLLFKQGAGRLTLAETNPFDGLVVVNSGHIVLKEAQALAKAGVALNIDNALDLQGAAAVTLGSLQGAGALNLGKTALSVGGDLRGVMYSGVLSADATAPGSLAKTGSNTLTLAGHGSRTGALTVNDGSLNLTNGATLQATDMLVRRAASMQGTLLVSASVLGGTTLTTQNLAVSEEDPRPPGSTAALAAISTAMLVEAGSMAVAGTTAIGAGPDLARGWLQISYGGHFDGGLLQVGAAQGSEGLVEVVLGGQLQTGTAVVGRGSNSKGTVIIDGVGSRWVNSGFIYFGQAPNSSGPTALGHIVVRNGGALQAQVLDLVADGATLTVDGGTVRTDYLSGANAQFTTVTVELIDPVGGTALTLSPPASVGFFAGNIRGSGSLLKTGAGSYGLIGNNQFTGRVTVEGGLLEMSSGAASAYRVGTGATLGLSFALLGAPVQVDAGGTLRLASLTLDGAALANQGRVLGDLSLQGGASASGAGRYDSLQLLKGSSFSPGDGVGLAHSGSATWASGAQVSFDMAAASGVAGSDWDLWVIDGGLTLHTNNNGLFPLRVALRAATLPGFDTEHAGQWLLIDTAQGIQGFAPGALTLDLSGFAPDLQGGQFSLAVSGGDLYLQFAPVPEAPAWLLLGAGLLAGTRLRRPRA